MQCARCYFSNPQGSRVCEYCGARLDATTDLPVASGASDKRKTMLGPAPKLDAPARPPPAPRPRLDPEDPFRIAAQGVVTVPPTPRPAPPATEPPQPTPPVASPPPQAAPPVATPRAHRATLVNHPAPAQAALAGVALVIEPDGTARSLVLREGRTRIGRRPDAEIVVADERASTDHALLRIEGGRAWLLDTSANGTRVSGVNCMNDRADVSDGTVLEIGATVVVLKLLGEDSLCLLSRTS